MKLIIDIPEERYKHIQEEQWLPNRLLIEKAIANGIPLPKGHGRLIDADALFDYFGNDALDEVTRSNIEYFIRETKATIIEADTAESEE